MNTTHRHTGAHSHTRATHLVKHKHELGLGQVGQRGPDVFRPQPHHAAWDVDDFTHCLACTREPRCGGLRDSCDSRQ